MSAEYIIHFPLSILLPIPSPIVPVGPIRHTPWTSCVSSSESHGRQRSVSKINPSRCQHKNKKTFNGIILSCCHRVNVNSNQHTLNIKQHNRCLPVPSTFCLKIISFAVSEKKITSSSALKSTPIKYEGDPVTGNMMSSWEDRLNGIPLTASWLENSRKCLTAKDKNTDRNRKWARN